MRMYVEDPRCTLSTTVIVFVVVVSGVDLSMHASLPQCVRQFLLGTEHP